MVGIAGLLAKRKQAIATPSSITQELPKATAVSIPKQSQCDGLQDPFSFDDRPSTSGSYGFSSGYMDIESFDNYEDEMPVNISSTSEDDAFTSLIPRDIRSLDIFSQARDDKNKSQDFRVKHAIDANMSPKFANDIEMITMPPPPPRSLSSSSLNHLSNPKPLEKSDTSQDKKHVDCVREISPSNSHEVTITGTISKLKDEGKIDLSATHHIDSRVEDATSNTINLEQSCLNSQAFDGVAVDARSPKSEIKNQSIPAKTPHNQTNFAGLVTPDNARDDENKCAEGFDDMHKALLHNLQLVKDNNIQSEEQMMDMELYLDHVIAIINSEILDIQALEDELDEVEFTQDEVLALLKSKDSVE